MNKVSGIMSALVLLLTMGGVYADAPVEEKKLEPAQAAVKPEAKAPKNVNKECEAPGWAKAIGHEEKWKMHNGCNSATPKASETEKATPIETKPVPAPEAKQDCVAPDWAVKIGHKEKWKLHNCQ